MDYNLKSGKIYSLTTGLQTYPINDNFLYIYTLRKSHPVLPQISNFGKKSYAIAWKSPFLGESFSPLLVEKLLNSGENRLLSKKLLLYVVKHLN